MSLKQTSLHQIHQKLGARMVDFAGFSMPVQYSSIVDEHKTVRSAAGLFDLGHMGRILITGSERMAFLDGLVTNKVLGLPNGAARYGLMLNERGTVLDDVIYYIFPKLILLVVNASNREKILAWLEQQQGQKAVQIEDVTFDWGMIALQGPKAKQVMLEVCDTDLKRVKNYAAAGGTVFGIPALVARTGYTGEDGFELYFDAKRAPFVFDQLLAVGAEHGVKACGLGARDTLRLEAGMPLYGHEIDDQTNPLEAGLSFAVELDKGEFMGRSVLKEVEANGPAKRLVGFFLEGRGVPRQGYEIFVEGEDTACGVVTSGTHSPTLERPLCMAFVPGGHADDTRYELGLRKKRLPLTMTRMPFYKRKRKKKKKKTTSPEQA